MKQALNNVILGLGSNLGDRAAYLKQAISLLNDTVGVVYKQSTVYETAPWGNTNQPVFFNQVVALHTALSPQQVLTQLLTIEADMGRVRTQQWAERIIDIDILLYNELVLHEEGLDIPHPLMHERMFVLEPLLELFPEIVHPDKGRPFADFVF